MSDCEGVAFANACFSAYDRKNTAAALMEEALIDELLEAEKV